MPDTTKNNSKEIQEKLELELKDSLLKDPSEKSFQEAYDKLHTFFVEQEKRDSLYPTDLKWFSKIFVDLAKSGNTILDIGSGNGKLALAMAQTGNIVTGLDVSKIAVKTAQERLKKIAPDLPVDFRQGDARKLPFEENTFDFITSQDLVEHISEDDFRVHLKEVYRVLKPRGHYVFWTPSELRGGSSLGLHLKEYTISEMDEIIRQTDFTYSWIDLRFYKLKFKITVPQTLMFSIIAYEWLLKRAIKLIPSKVNKLFVPPLLFQLKK